MQVSSPAPLPAPSPNLLTGSSPTPSPLLSLARTPTTETGGQTMPAVASAQSPLRPTPPPPPGPRQSGGEEEDQCSVCHEGLSDPQVHLDCCTQSLHLPCFYALRVRAETESRCPTCRAAVTVDRSDPRVLQEHSDEVMSAESTTARTGMPERDQRTARRARFAVGGDAAKG